ncbi:MAG TPA: ATP-binding protein [Puia sp.]|nr:ATP-binding protein [Puia sp.]
MNFNILKNPILVSYAVLMSFGFIIYAVYDTMQRFLVSQQTVDQTEQVISRSDNILSLSKDMVIAYQNAAIAKDSNFHEPLAEMENKISTYIGEIRQLTADNGRQQRRIDSLNFYIHQQLGLLIHSTLLGTYNSDDTKYIERIRIISRDIQTEEGNLLKQRKETSRHSLEMLSRYSMFVLILMVSFSVFLLIASRKYFIQKREKEARDVELSAVNKSFIFQNEEKEKRAAELLIANQELVFQNKEKEKRAAELIVANTELAFQNKEKEKRAAELIIANTELIFQNEEKEKRAAELIIVNKELQNAEDDIRKLNEELEYKVIERTEQLKTANTELESFSYSVSHDLRAPIRAISGYAQILEEDHGAVLDADGTKVLHSIRNNAIKMGKLIDDLLAFSQLGRKQVMVIEINMNDLVLPIITDLVLDDTEKRIEFTVTDLPPSKGDPSLIKQVWINLLSNAIKYSKYKTKSIIEAGAYKKDNFVIYYLKDNGAGFDMKYYDKLFGVFQRLHSQDEFEGTGIGLANIQKIVHRHNGTVWAESREDEGTCFYFSLPDINA